MPKHDSLERALYSGRDEPSEAQVPPDLDAFIRKGIELGQAERRKERIRARRRLWTGSAALMLLAACVFSIRLSPAFASLLRDIPGLEYFVNYIRHSEDRSLGWALDNDLVQPLGISEEYEGVSLTIEGLLADDNRAVIFYSIDSGSDRVFAKLDKWEITDRNGESLGAMISSGETGVEQEKPFKGKSRGTIDIQMAEGKRIPDIVVVKTKLNQGDPENPDAVKDAVDPFVEPPSVVVPDRPNEHQYEIAVPVDHSKFEGMKRVYEINETIDVEDQLITFARATVHPLQVMLEVKGDPSNAKRIFSAGDIRMTDETGAEWKSFWSMGDIGDGATIGFESSYFHEPKELYVEGSWFRAQDKDKLEVVVDTEREKLIRAPDSRLQLTAVGPYGKYTKLTFSLSVDRDTDNMFYFGIFSSEYKDASGKKYEMASFPGGTISGAGGMSGPGIQDSYFYLEDMDYKQPLTLSVYSYPSYIRGPYKIRIK